MEYPIVIHCLVEGHDPTACGRYMGIPGFRMADSVITGVERFARAKMGEGYQKCETCGIEVRRMLWD